MQRRFQRARVGDGAKMTAADLIAAASLAALSEYQNPYACAEAFSGRRMEFRGPQLTALVLRSANIADRNGVSYESDDELERRRGWFVEEFAAAEEAEGAVPGAAHFESGLHVPGCRVNAFDTSMASTRRAVCAGISVRRFLTFQI